MRYFAMVWAPHDRAHQGRQPNEDDIGKPSNIGGATELDPIEPVRQGHLSPIDLDAAGPVIVGDTAALLDADWIEVAPEFDEPVADEE